MKTLIFHIMLCVATVIAIPPAAAQDSMAEWTIMVFMNADNNLEPYGLQDFMEMSKIGSSAKINIIVQMDRVPGFSNAFGDWTQALRFRVEKDKEPIPANALSDLGEVDMGLGEELADFVIWAMQKYPAKKYMLDIWNHGQGWRYQERTPYREKLGLGKGAPDEQPNIAEQMSLRDRLGKLARATKRDAEGEWQVLSAEDQVPGVLRYISSDDTNNSHLYNREIQDKLQGVLGNGKLELIGFDACLMGMVETAYAMRNVAKFMVGSEELEPGAGWQYTLWLGRLATNPDVGGLELSQTLVTSFEEVYQAGFPDTTLSAVDLARINALASAISALATACKDNIDSVLQALKSARSSCDVYAPGYGLHGIDLGRFCEVLGNSCTDPVIKEKATSTRAALGQTVIANYAGADRQQSYGSQGLAIYFPESNNAFILDKDRDGYRTTNLIYPVQFVQDHAWDEFLHAYYEMVK